MDFETTYSTTPIETQSSENSFEVQYEQERGKPMPSKNHAILQMEIGFELKMHFGSKFDIFPELSLELSTGKAVPDLCIYEKTPRNWQVDVIRTKEVPLLAIEILSPKQSLSDIVDKINSIYFPAGMKSVWVILPPAESVMVFKPNSKTHTYNEGILKDDASGFELNLDKIFV
jgi:Uma2 family endonuclease